MPKKIGCLQKIKMELTIILIVILGIVAFFVYAKIINVQTAEQIRQQTVISQQISIDLAGVRYELGKNNCLVAANGDDEKIAECRGAGVK